MSQLYFAFGSNMSLLTLRDQGVVANPAGTALLEHDRLAFTLPSKRWTGRAADILPAPGVGVWGVLWEMAEPDALDPFELRYLHIIPGFEPSPTDPLHLVLLTKDIRHTMLGIQRRQLAGCRQSLCGCAAHPPSDRAARITHSR